MYDVSSDTFRFIETNTAVIIQEVRMNRPVGTVTPPKVSTVRKSRFSFSNKQAQNLATKPDFIWQYCQRIKEEYKGKPIAIYIDCKNSINRKEYKSLIDPNYDMAKAEWNYFAHNEWILLY